MKGMRHKGKKQEGLCLDFDVSVNLDFGFSIQTINVLHIDL